MLLAKPLGIEVLLVSFSDGPRSAAPLSLDFRARLLRKRILNMITGRGNYPEPIAFQVTTAARLLDHTLDAWDAVRENLGEHIAGARSLPTSFGPGEAIPPAHDWTRQIFQALFRATSRLEDVVDSHARLLRLAAAIEASSSIQGVPGPLLSPTDREKVREFRNRITHGDEDLAKGKGGKGLVTATLRVDATGPDVRGAPRRLLAHISHEREHRASRGSRARDSYPCNPGVSVARADVTGLTNIVLSGRRRRW